MRGVIVRIVRDKGFGFIQGSDNVERFFHCSAVSPGVNFDGLAEGDAVTFNEDRSPRGPRAKDIDPVHEGHDQAEETPYALSEATAPTPRAIPVGRGKAEAARRAPSHRRSARDGVRTRR